MRRAAILALFFAALLGPATAARAQAQEPPPAVPGQSTDEQAQHLADEAVTAYRGGKYAAAVALFKQAYALRADPAILYNLAKCFEKMGQQKDALEYYRRYLVAEGTDAKLRQKAEEKVASLSAALAPAAKAVAGAPEAPPPRPFRTLFFTGVGLAAAGAAGLLIGVGLYGVAAREHSAFSASQDEFDKRAARDRALTLGQGSVASYVIGGALLAGGAALVGVASSRGFFRKERRGGNRRDASRAARMLGGGQLGLAPLQGGGMALFTGSF